MPTEAQVLAHMMDRTREYTQFYLGKLKDTDPHRAFICEGVTLNTMYWLVAHLTASENGLLLYATGGPFEKFSWAKHFTVGSTPPPREQCPPYDEVLAMFHSVHTRSIAHLRTLTPETLEGPDRTRLPLVGTTVRDTITHAIRHEGSHVGHLGWLCKLNGIKTV